MNNDITITITQDKREIITATITQCGGVPASQYLAAIKILTNQISGVIDCDALDIDLSIPSALAYRTGITQITAKNATTVGTMACNGMSALATLNAPDIVTVGDFGFAQCALTGEFKATFPQVTKIGYLSFDRTKFESVDLTGVESLGARSFRAGNIKKVWLPKEIAITQQTAYTDAPFIGNEDVNLMIYTDCPDEATAIAQWGEFWDNLSETAKAAVLYGETHENYLND